MNWVPSFQLEKKVKEIISSYPEPQSACLPILHEIQSQSGYIPRESISWVAKTIKVPRSQIEGVISFYTMFKTEPVGKYHLELCTNISCSLCGSESILRTIEKELGIRAGETTKDGLFTLSEVECLATCGMGPAMQVGDEIYEKLTPEKVIQIISDFRKRG